MAMLKNAPSVTAVFLIITKGKFEGIPNESSNFSQRYRGPVERLRLRVRIR